MNTGVPGTSGLALMQFQNGGYAALGDGFALPTAYWDTNYQYGGSLTWTKGAHTYQVRREPAAPGLEHVPGSVQRQFQHQLGTDQFDRHAAAQAETPWPPC